jgi:multidrug efflux pump subunit AcrB
MSTAFFHNRHLLVLTIVVTLIAGLASAFSLPRLEDPRIVNRNPLILIPAPGASAERVEALIVEPIEERLQEISEIAKIESTSRAGIAVIAIELEAATTTAKSELVFSEIRDRIAEVEPLLPPEAAPPIVDDKRQAIAFTLIYGLSLAPGLDPDEEERALGLIGRLAEELSDRLRQLDGTELARLYGEPAEEIRVVVDEDELTAMGLTTAQVAAAARASDSKVAAGIVRGSRSSVLLEVAGELDTTARIAAVPLRIGGDPRGAMRGARIGDVATVSRARRTPDDEIALIDGRRSVLVGARVGVDQQASEWTTRAEQLVERFRREIGDHIIVDKVFEQSRYTQEQLAALGGNLLAGAGVVIAVVFLMMGWRQSLIVGAALPLVTGLVLFAMQLLGIRLHQMSIFGLIIALGLLIDNAIVVTDEVSARLREPDETNASPIVRRANAVREAVRHLTGPLTASTLTTVFAFAPIMLLPGNAGDFVGSIGQMVVLAIVFSLFVALTITASLAGWLVPLGRDGEPTRSPAAFWKNGFASDRLERWWSRTLAAAYRAPLAAVLFAMFLPVLGFGLSRTLGREFFPPVDRNMFQVEVWLPSQVAIDHTRAVAERVEDVIRGHETVDRVHWMVGSSFPTVYYNLLQNKDQTPSYAQAIVVTSSPAATKALVDPLQEQLSDAFPDAQIIVRKFGQGPPVIADVQYRVFGPDLSRLQDVGETLQNLLQTHPDVRTTRVSMTRGEPKMWLRADEDKARLAGLELRDLADDLQAKGEGAVGGSLLEQLENLPVRVRLEDARREDPAAIASSLFPARAGSDGTRKWVPLEALGDLDLSPEIGGITRYGGRRCNVVEGYVRDGSLPIEISRSVLAAFEPPPGYSIREGGEAEQDAEASGNLAIYAPLLVTAAITTLILSFRSLALAAILLGVAGLSVGLGQLATWTISFPVSFTTILGTLGLIGVAINDSIVVLAAIRAHPEARSGDPDAVVRAVNTCTRHVLSTTLTTVGGFLPLLLFVGGDFWPSLAIVLCGGILGASLLAVLFVPGVYVLGARGWNPERGSPNPSRKPPPTDAVGAPLPAPTGA